MTFLTDLFHFMRAHLMELIWGAFVWQASKIGRWAITAYENKHKKENSLDRAVMHLIKIKVMQLMRESIERNALDYEQKADIDELMVIYKELGGNGRADLLYNKILKIEVCD